MLYTKRCHDNDDLLELFVIVLVGMYFVVKFQYKIIRSDKSYKACIILK